MNLNNISIHNTGLSCNILENTNLNNFNLQNVEFINIYCNGTKFNNAHINNCTFGVIPDRYVDIVKISEDKQFIVGVSVKGKICIYDLKKLNKIK